MSLAAENVSLRRGEVSIVSRADIVVRPGTVTALVGPNGAGKSSLLRMLSGELAASGGFVTLDTMPLSEIPIAEQALQRGVMSQSATIAFDFLVSEVLELGWVHEGLLTREQKSAAVRSVVEDCDIGTLLDRTFNTLSGGEQQRVHFARTLLQIWQPPGEMEDRYLLLDEPTSNLDLAHEIMMLRVARHAASRRAGILIVLHDLNLAARFCDEIVLMDRGEVVAIGTPAEVLDSDRLSNVYGTDIQVEWHDALERWVIHS